MKIILKYILNNVRERKLRTMVMMLSVILSVTLLFVSLTIGDSYESAQQKMAKGFAGKTVVAVSAKPDANGNMVWIKEEVIPKLPSIQNKVGFLMASALYKEGSYYENFDLIAADLEELNTINKPRLLDGSELTDFTGNDIVLPEKFTSIYGLVPGDTITLNIGGENYQFKLAAIAPYDTVFLRQTRGFNALLPKERLAKILKASGGNSKILIEPAKGISGDELKSELKSVIPDYSVTKVYDEAQVAQDAKQKSLPFYLISFFSVIMSIFIIFSSYKVITLERLPVIGTFRSIGATKKATSGILLMESLLYGIFGGLLGIPLGYVLLKLILNGLGKSLSIGIEIPMVVSPVNIMLSCLAAVLVAVFSAYIPIYRASRLPVKDVVLGLVEEKKSSSKIKLGFGIVLFILSLFLPRMINKNNSDILFMSGGFSLLSLMIATIIIIPLFSDALSYLLEWLYGVILGNEGKLAARNMRQNKNIHQNITLLFISLSAVIVISTVISFTTSYVGDIFGDGTLDGFAQGEMSPEFVKKVENMEGVKEVLPVYELENVVSSDQIQFARLEGADNLKLLNSMLGVEYEKNEKQANMEDIFEKGRNILLSKAYLKQHNRKPGEVMKLSYKNVEYQYKILGSFMSRGDNSDAIIPAAYAKSDFGAVNYGMLSYTAADPDAVMVQIKNLFGNKYNWSRTVEEFKKDFLGTVNAFLKPMKKLTYFILLLAAIGVINNLLINYIQKKRSIAMYKSVGLSNRQNLKMTLAEGLTSGMIGAVIALFVAYMQIQTIFLVAGPRIAVVPRMDASIFIMAGISGIIINLVGSAVPILKSYKMKLVEEIKFE